jgi:hypothetical protein
MRAVVAVLLGLALLAAGFGVYRWLDDDEERARAETAAEELAAFCRHNGSPCDVVRIERISSGMWRFHVRDPVGGTRCMAVELENFRASTTDSIYVGGSTEGVTDTACGPEWWASEDAAARLEDSPWALERKARSISCAGEGGSPGRSWYFRRFDCRYYSPSGGGNVVLTTTGATTFELEPVS